jgi:hypothetical protein
VVVYLYLTMVSKHWLRGAHPYIYASRDSTCNLGTRPPTRAPGHDVQCLGRHGSINIEASGAPPCFDLSTLTISLLTISLYL